MFLKNKNIIFKIRRSKVTDYAALTFFFSGDLCFFTEYFKWHTLPSKHGVKMIIIMYLRESVPNSTLSVLIYTY